MWWFTPSNERRMDRRYRARQSSAQQLNRDIGITKLAGHNAALINEALRLTMEEEALFERMFGEPMPHQLSAALHAETQLWTELKNRPANDNRATRRLATIQKLLSLQREMLHTPLVRKYQQAIERLQRER